MVPLVSVVMIVRDGAADLSGCLGPGRGLFGEVVVADTGSADATRAVAAGLGARVVEVPWADSFAAARNVALGHARGDWAFWLDADDRLDPPAVAALARLLGSLPDANAAFTMTTVSPTEDGEAAVEHVRLFRRHPRHRWRYRVHEQIAPALRETRATVHRTDIVIRHTGYADPAVRRRKLLRDLRLLHLEAAENPHDPHVLFYLGAVQAELGRWADAIPPLAAVLAGPHPPAAAPRAHALLAQCHRRLGDPA
ncbi:MAG: glycosyltransferase, partial [Gemmataceae bacterium]|nr:glycosyltransferase [Gemmataceae bacterium]